MVDQNKKNRFIELTQKAIKKFREKPDIPTQWAKNLREKIKLSNSQDSINNEYDKVFSREIE